MENTWMIIGIILAVNVVYVSFFTLRMIFTLKGQRYFAAFISMFEIVVYIYGLGLVLDRLDQWENVVAYAAGYGLGVIVGMKIEEKLALGYITVNVISSDPDIEFTKRLREKGYGVTSWYAYGMEGDRLAMQILTPRKYELLLYKTIRDIDPKAFIVAYEPKQIHGGFWAKSVKGGKIQHAQEQQKAL
ncbi:DUF2179 domain-containing protein [Halobacillus fulvus]|nr:DUF2179 domain-containing protein [Halobacillus fulvus]